VITVPSLNGKIQAQDLEKYIDRLGDQHFSQVKVISITQPTELGTLYSLDELKKIKQIATKYNLKLHIDGARFIVAAQSLKKTFKELTLDIGVDSLSFGGTKNGLLFGEIVIFFNSENSLDDDFKYIRKQMMQLPSKQRFIAQQFLTLLNENLYKSIADHEIQMAQYLYKKIKDIPQLEIMFPVQANSVFVKIPKEWVKPLKKSHFFYVWDAHQWIMRWMCSFDTQTTTIDDFVKQIELLAYKS